MRYVILPEQDYSNRFFGSWGRIIVEDPADVDDAFRTDDTCKVLVQDDDGTDLTEQMDADQWYDWKNKRDLRL